MESGPRRMPDWPEPCDDILTIATAEETTLVDAISRDRLDREDLDTFLNHVDAAAHDVDPGLIHLVKIIDTFLEDHDV
ncbi:hypothetical protein [Halorubrum coriense]|uniref:hypothetical protein n=1 Tax=Halorubrum coriense TaxID=64713 RepID=UPI00126923EB|nr:hypothetical protein [Halorubrum coriense]